jgi:hypothetical protein
MQEVWVDVKNWEDLYQVSNLGNVKSKPKAGGNGFRERLLKQEELANGYKRVTFSKNGKVNRYSVHRIVAENFINNLSNKTHINHIDNDRANNSISNLEWCTHSENMLHAQKQGRLYSAQLKGGEATKAIIALKIVKKFKDFFGINFIAHELCYKNQSKSPRSYIRYSCKSCSAISMIRIDSQISDESKLLCKNCR